MKSKGSTVPCLTGELHCSLSLNLTRLYQFTKIMYASAILLTYNLQFYVPFTLLWPRISRKILRKSTNRARAIWEHVVRVALILVTCKLSRHLCRATILSIKNLVTTVFLRDSGVQSSKGRKEKRERST